MEATDQSTTNHSQDSDHVLRTLPANPPADIQSQPEASAASNPTTSRVDSDVPQTESPLASSGVPKGLSDLSGHRPKLVGIKELATIYGIKVGAIYAFIKTEPDFPYVNVGVKKKFMVDVAQFETWVADRTKKQKHQHFAIPSSLDLLNAFKGKNPGGIK